MGKLTALRDLAKNNAQLAHRATKMLSRVSIIAKGFGQERIAKALSCDEAFKELSCDIWDKLPIEMQKDMNKEFFMDLLLENKTRLMRKKKNRKKLKKR